MSEPISDRTTLHRYAHRGLYDRPSINAILDQGIVCHVGVHTEQGFPVVIPLAYGRKDDTVFLHGSAASRLFRNARKASVEVCMTVTFVDGLVVARSTYNTDINYRSVMIIGDASEVTDLDDKRAGLDVLVEHILPGRTRDARPPTEKELRSTMLLALPITESSAKVRTGWPEDEPEDYDLAIWAGVLSIDQRVAAPRTDPALRFELEPPDYVVRYPRFA
jgi:nitroimidazol reductase NimA-like FMN-containing flavoprotein (pyridoxamine 5'-phosphate oxidase superfamily)